jgi:hypothetical protein
MAYDDDDAPASNAKLQIHGPIPPPHTIRVHFCLPSFLKVFLKN